MNVFPLALLLTLLASVSGEHRVRRREAHYKPKYSDQDIKVVSPPQLDSRESRHRNLHGYLKLHPIGGPRGSRRSFQQERVMSGYKTLPDGPKTRPLEFMNLGERFARWFFSSDEESGEVRSSGTAPRVSVARPPPNFSSKYEKYPPFWQEDNGGSYARHNVGPKGPPRPQPQPQPQPKHYKYVKKDCNPCNSVPWIPISKSPAGSGLPLSPVHHHDTVGYSSGVPLHAVHHDTAGYSSGVPLHAIHHDTAGYSSSQQIAAVLPPAPVVHLSHHFPDSTISNSYGLPAGNIPTGHGLLAPVNHLAQIPSSYSAPTFIQPIPFPELSSVNIAPIHNPAQFSSDPQDLVPPIAPQKSVSNVIFTISEQQEATHHNKKENVRLVGENSVAPDQSSESSSLIDTHTVPKQQDVGRQQYGYQQNYNTGLDIVKSIPLIEYTSSIEYPLHFIQSPPYIDIATSENTTAPNVRTYEKEPQTGAQKISDILFGGQNTDSKKLEELHNTDNDASGSVISEHASKSGGKVSENRPFKSDKTTTAVRGEATTPTPIHSNEGRYEGTGNSPFYIEVQTGSPGLEVHPQPVMQSFQNSFHEENGHLVMDTVGQGNPPFPDVQRDYLDPNILTPPPVPPTMTQLLPHNEKPPFKLVGVSSGSPTPYLNPPGLDRPTKETPLHIPQSPSPSWLLPAQTDAPPHWLLPASTSVIPFPFNTDTQHRLATVVNGGLLPPPIPQPLNTGQQKPKKIQIIIPYTTINSKDFDQNALETVHRDLYQALLNDSSVALPESERAHTWMPIVVTEQTELTNQGRKKPPQTSDNFKNTIWKDAQQSETRPVKSEMKHILATNIRELLSDEVQKAKSEQNIRLQKNIDNWTALEYSNHKVVAKKEPVDVISHAQAVTTTIPGTSISHLLLPSKKIPQTYFTTTPSPTYDDPHTTPYKSSSVSVESRPFTYTTASMYSTVAVNGLFTTTPKPTTKQNVFKLGLDKLEQLKQQNIRNSQLSSFASLENQKNGYSDPSKTKIHRWEKLRGNLPIPEDSSKTLGVEATTRSSWADYKISISPGTNEKVYVVTPVSMFQADDFKRTTRAISATPKPTVYDIKTSETVGYPSKNTRPFNSFSFTKLEKVKNTTASTTSSTTTTTTKPFNKTKSFAKNESTQLYQLKTNKTELYKTKISKFNKPKPLDKFFATTKSTPKNQNQTKEETVTENKLEVEESSINDVFPFRNGGELPVEMSQANLDARLLEFRNTGERKTLIKQVKINKKQRIETTTEKKGITEQIPTGTTIHSDLIEDEFHIDVVLPPRSNVTSTKDHSKKKVSNSEEKKKFVKGEDNKNFKIGKLRGKTPQAETTANTPASTTKKNETQMKISPDEPNITDDEREEINDLPENQKRNKHEGETLIAVESALPKGVFGETTKVNKSKTEPFTFRPEAIQETIHLLMEFLEESGKIEKTDKVKKFKEHDRLLTGLETLTPVLSKAPIEPQTIPAKDVKENFKSLENKLLKKLDNKKQKDMYLYNFPEYLISDLNLTKDELSLVEGAMVELRKNKLQKSLEQASP